MSATDEIAEVSNLLGPLLNELVEAAYWKFCALKDPTQTETPASDRDAFKSVVLSTIVAACELTRATREEPK